MLDCKDIVDSMISSYGQFPDLPIAFCGKRQNKRLDNNSLKSSLKNQHKKIIEIKDIVDFWFLDSSIEATVDDVIGMTHRKIILFHNI